MNTNDPRNMPRRSQPAPNTGGYPKRYPAQGSNANRSAGYRQPYAGSPERRVQRRPAPSNNPRASANPNSRYGTRAAGSSARPGYENAYRSSANVRPSSLSGQTAPARQPGPAKSSQKLFSQKAASFLKKALSVLIMLIGILASAFAFAGKGVRKANRKLDIFRKTDIQKTVTNSLLTMVALILVISLLIVCAPAIRMGWGGLLVTFGKFDRAAQVALKAENAETAPDKVLNLRYKIVNGYIKEKQFDKALSVLLLTDEGSQKTAGLRLKANLGKAEAMYQSGQYEDASRIFYLLNTTEEGYSRYHDCLCAMAIEAYLVHNDDETHQLLMQVSGIKDRIERVAFDVTKDRNAVSGLISSETFNPENLKQLEETIQLVTSIQDRLPVGKIAAGDNHTLGLRSDGTVLGTGDNLSGQLNVAGWTNITSVAAGAQHSVGLKTDGTVVATGDNTYGQLEVSGWTNIVKIACSAYDTIGLRSDGTVISCGMHKYGGLAQWNNVTMITGGAYSVGALYDQGTSVSSNKSAQLKSRYLLADFSVSGACSAGVSYDGTLISNLPESPDWSNLIRVEATTTGILAITSDGQVMSYFFRASDNPGIQVNKKAVDVVSSGTHHVILFEDGTVQAFGHNDYGQLNVSGWQL